MDSERTADEPGSGGATVDGESPVARLAAALTAAAGSEGPTPRELAELLWMAKQLGPAEEAPDSDAAVPAPQAAADVVPPRPASDPLPPPNQAPTAPTDHDGRVPLLLPAPSPQPVATSGGGAPLLAPAPPMLHRPLELQRALRPLKRKVPSPRARVLDERATADRIARLGAHPDIWLPVLRPAPDRWLHLNLVHDTGPTMPVWRPLVRELHAVLAQSGIFRTITVQPATPDGRARHVPAPDDGRTVTLVISDCMGPQWRPGEAGARWYGTLHRWAARMPLAVLQPLPEHLWPTTALPAEPGLLTPPAAAAPTSSLGFTPYDPETPPPPAAAVPLPVLEPGAPWLANWAALLADPGGGRMPGAAAWLPETPHRPAEPAPGIASLGPEDLVLRFRATASPEAFRLAGHLALGVPSVPVMRLVQRTVDRDPRPQHLAEVILSGMLQSVPGPAGSYEFRPGVRELLLRSLPRTARGRTREFLARIGGLIDERAGFAAGEFRAEAGSGDGSGSVFARVRKETLDRLGAGASREQEPEQAQEQAPAPAPAPEQEHPRGTIVFEAGDLSGRPEARITLENAVHEMLSRGALPPQHYEVRVRDNGYLVLTEPDAYLLPVLVAVLRGLPEMLGELADPPRVAVTFWRSDAGEAPPRIPSVRGDVLVISPALYDEFTVSSTARGSQRFHPWYGSASVPSPVAWYCPLSPPAPDHRDLVQGPFITQDLRELGIPAPGRTAVVHTRPDGPLTLLNPAQPYAGRPRRPATYYEVDLTPHHSRHEVSLPSSGKGDFSAAVELSWHVDDPVTFVRSETDRISERLLEHLLYTAGDITRHHSLRRATGAERAVNAGLRSWPVPGLSVTCAVRLAPEWAPPPAPQDPPVPSPRRLSDVLAGAETVLLGFDGPLTRLFSAKAARTATLDLLSLVAEHRDPEDALAGRPLPRVTGAGREVFTHPLDLLRAFAHDRLGPLLRERLDQLELQAVPDAPTTHHSVPLVRALHDSGRRVHVVTDVCGRAVRRYLEPYRLPLAGVHGRGEDLGLLLPHPDCLLRALRSPDAPAATGVLIGSSVAELTAAQQVGLRFVGLARNPTVDQSLREAGCEITVSSLAPVLEAARSL